MSVFIKTRLEYTYIDSDDGPTETQICGACTTYCTWNFNDSGGKISVDEYLAYQRIIDATCGSATYGMTLVYDGFGTIGNRFIVKADGVSLFNSGCITVSGSTSITVPANTETFEVLVYGSCLAGSDVFPDAWSFAGTCA